jgi:PTS system galactitol-specific IIA component
MTPSSKETKNIQLVRDHFYYNQRFQSKEELFEALSKQLMDEGYVKSGYYDALISREQKFPTGIESKINLAIPHADPHNVNQSTFMIVTLADPINFASMVEPEKFLEVKLVILMVLDDGKDQIAFLKRIPDLAGDNEMLSDVLNRESEDQFVFFKEFFSQI